MISSGRPRISRSRPVCPIIRSSRALTPKGHWQKATTGWCHIAAPTSPARYPRRSSSPDIVSKKLPLPCLNYAGSYSRTSVFAILANYLLARLASFPRPSVEIFSSKKVGVQPLGLLMMSSSWIDDKCRRAVNFSNRWQSGSKSAFHQTSAYLSLVPRPDLFVEDALESGRSRCAR